MALEIERKFLVIGEYKSLAMNSTRIIQGYLSSVPERTVRVRIKGEQGFITIKGAGATSGSHSGTTRFEWEKEIPVEEAKELLAISEPGVIDKTRFIIPNGRHSFEVDEFYGDNLGLTVAEIELSSEKDHFEKPEWLGKEVTGDQRYYNSELVKHPYTKWCGSAAV
ncbi:MAG: hypothetical protein ACD_77C00018G0001 [uncultured bacterium]|nr:MAG: hypothetical protein ACD_77C00018G0001 [uncultured bacterium]HBY01763.1 adenylate cyclase [Rikenellaceae bacterium]